MAARTVPRRLQPCREDCGSTRLTRRTGESLQSRAEVHAPLVELALDHPPLGASPIYRVRLRTLGIRSSCRQAKNAPADRQSVVVGKGGSVRVERCGRGNIKKKKN